MAGGSIKMENVRVGVSGRQPVDPLPCPEAKAIPAPGPGSQGFYGDFVCDLELRNPAKIYGFSWTPTDNAHSCFTRQRCPENPFLQYSEWRLLHTSTSKWKSYQVS
jgi:hypothetical protein